MSARSALVLEGDVDIQGLGFGVWDLGFKVSVFDFRDQGLGLRV